MLHFFWSIVAFIVTLSILITVHEYGHFLVARFCGVAVECFSIGFGRALWRRRDKRGTEYVISIIPLGGYIKMLDERIQTVSSDRYHEIFNYKSVWQRIAIISAGPIFNFLLAVLTYWLVFIIGVSSYRPVIGEIIPNSIIAHAKILPGMELKSVGNVKTPDWDSVRLQLLNKIGDNEANISVALFGSSYSEQKTIDLSSWQFEPGIQDPIMALGIVPLGPNIEQILAKVQPASAAAKAGLQIGDKIIKVNDQPVNDWQFFVNKIRNSPESVLKVEIERQGYTMNITLRPDSKLVGNGKIEGFAGVIPKVTPLSAEYKIIQQLSPIPALIHAGKKTWQLMKLTVSMLKKLLTGDIKLNSLSGPLSIARGAGISAEYGLVYYLMFLSLISINLGIINLFPLPVLDGGHLFFLIIEKIKGNPVSERVQKLCYNISSVLLALLMCLALFNDFSKLW